MHPVIRFRALVRPPQASTREEAARWVEVLKVLQTMEEEESKVIFKSINMSFPRTRVLCFPGASEHDLKLPTPLLLV